MCSFFFFLPDRSTHLHEREGDGKRNILSGWPDRWLIFLWQKLPFIVFFYWRVTVLWIYFSFHHFLSKTLMSFLLRFFTVKSAYLKRISYFLLTLSNTFRLIANLDAKRLFLFLFWNRAFVNGSSSSCFLTALEQDSKHRQRFFVCFI